MPSEIYGVGYVFVYNFCRSFFLFFIPGSFVYLFKLITAPLKGRVKGNGLCRYREKLKTGERKKLKREI